MLIELGGWNLLFFFSSQRSVCPWVKQATVSDLLLEGNSLGLVVWFLELFSQFVWNCTGYVILFVEYSYWLCVIVEWLKLEGIFKTISSLLPWAGCCPPPQAAQHPIQPGFESLQGWDICSFSGQSVPVTCLCKAPWGCPDCRCYATHLIFSEWALVSSICSLTATRSMCFGFTGRRLWDNIKRLPKPVPVSCQRQGKQFLYPSKHI